MKRKSRQDIEMEWRKYGFENKPRLIYKWDALNCKTYYNEVLKLLLENIESIKKIEKTKRRSEFYIDRFSTSSKKIKRKEERFCMALYFTSDKGEYPFGRVINYQVPLKPRKNEYGTKKDQEGMGKIDIVSLRGDSLYLIEAKRASTKDSLLKTILEIYTYFKQAVQNEHFKEVFGSGHKIFKPAILLFEGSKPANEIKSMNEGLKELLGLLEKEIKCKIHIFIVKSNIKAKNCNRRIVLFDKRMPKIQQINI